ncbi:MAG TPA: glycosyltransferase family 4 protein [Thermoplasmata archaeon]|nr:glycosyltransferase family 4 protein [Thermoplasmata archaeon]
MVAYTYYPWDPRVRREAETLSRRGHSVTVLCCREPGQQARELVAGVTAVRLPLTIRRGGRARYVFQYGLFFLLAIRALRGLRPSAVHVHSVPDLLAFTALGPRLRRVPLTLDLHEAMPELVAARFPNARFAFLLALVAERLSCGLATRILVVNETIRDLLVARSAPMDRVTVLYNSPDEAVEDRSSPQPRGETLRLVYAGTLDRERDLETLIRAVATLRPTLLTSLVVYGRGDPTYRAYLEGLVSGLELEDLVRFGGVLPSERVLAHLAGSDLGVVTYARNPLTEVALPNKVFEYVALDKPLVLPDLRALRRVFDGAAWFYQPGNAWDLAAKIREAALAGDASTSRRERARVVYAGTRWEVQAERLASLYTPTRKTLAPGGRATCM